MDGLILVLQSFWSPNVTFSVHNSSNISWSRVDKSCSFVNGRSINTTSVSKASDHAEVPSSMLSIYSIPVKFSGHIIDGSI